MYYQIGEFEFDLEQKILFRSGEEVGAEPMSMEVLAYLIKNRDRYTSLSDLHENIWTGKIVSDTAVRNVIKKLRTVLLDTNVSEPEYIKSVTKKGYKLICDIDVVSRPSAVEIEVSEPIYPELSEETKSLLDTSGGTAESLPFQKTTGSRSIFIGILLLTVSLFAVYVLQLGTKQLPSFSSEQKSSSSQIETQFPGGKYGITFLDNDKSFIFSGHSNGSADSQLYLFNKNSGAITQLTREERLVTDMLYLPELSAIAFNDMQVGDAAIKLIKLDANKNVISSRTLIDNLKHISRMSTGISNDKLLVPMMGKNDENIMVYELDINTGETKRITAPYYNSTHDYLAAISPGNHLIAFVRHQEQNNVLIVRDYHTQRQLHSVILDKQLRNLVWLNDDILLLGDSDELYQYNWMSGERQVVLEDNPNRLENFALDPNGQHVLVIENDDLHRQRTYVERELSQDMEAKNFFNVPQSVTSMYPTPQTDIFFVIHNTPNGLTLGLYNPNSGNISVVDDQLFFEKLRILTASWDGSQLLLNADDRLLRISVVNFELEYLTDFSQMFFDANFSQDGSAVLYTEQIAGEWVAIRRPLNHTESRTEIARGFKMALEDERGLILCDEEGNLFRKTGNDIRALNNQYKVRLWGEFRVHSVNNTIVWSVSDNIYTHLHFYNEITGEQTSQKFEYDNFLPIFYISPDRLSIWHKSQVMNSQVTRVSL